MRTRHRLTPRLQAVLLSVQSPAPEAVFAVVFATVSIGAVTLTLNVLLLARALLGALLRRVCGA